MKQVERLSDPDKIIRLVNQQIEAECHYRPELEQDGASKIPSAGDDEIQAELEAKQDGKV